MTFASIHPRVRVAAAFAALLLVGAGCTPASVTTLGDELGNAAVLPAKTSVEALVQAEATAELAQARANETGEMATDDITVAWILTEGTEQPSDATLLPNAIGCNDRVAFVKEHRATASGSTMQDALNTLFAIKDGSHGPLYNSLAYSNLSIEKVISPDGVTTEVWLKGDVSMGGACDAPRVKAQIEETVRRFKPHFRIILNGTEAAFRCLGDQSGTCYTPTL